jgi:RNA polymerase sigma-70 factor (ECF subfamily)
LSQEADLADVRRVLAGDPGAFEGIVRRWQRPLLGLAYRYCRDRGRAEDLVQEAFLRAFRKLRLYEGTSAFSSWLFKLASRVCISEMRRCGPPPTRERDLDRLPHWGSLAASLENRDLAETVRAAVTRLPAKYRDALILFYFLDKDLSETASAMGVPQGTVKARLHRGRELLRRRLEGRLAPRPAPKEA